LLLYEFVVASLEATGCFGGKSSKKEKQDKKDKKSNPPVVAYHRYVMQ
jgi:hypothetical protein